MSEQNPKTEPKKKKSYFFIFFILSMFIVAALQKGNLLSPFYPQLITSRLEAKYHEKFVFECYAADSGGTAYGRYHSVRKPNVSFYANWPFHLQDDYVKALVEDYVYRKIVPCMKVRADEVLYFDAGSKFANGSYYEQYLFYRDYGIANLDQTLDRNPSLCFSDRGSQFGVALFGPPERKEEMIKELYDIMVAVRKEFKSETISGGFCLFDIKGLSTNPEVKDYYAKRHAEKSMVILNREKMLMWDYGRGDGEPNFSNYQEFRDFREVMDAYHRRGGDPKNEGRYLDDYR